MGKKILVLFLLAVSSVIILPTQGNAKTADLKTLEITKTEPVAQRRYRNYQRRQQNRYYRRQIRRNNRQIRRSNRARWIRQYYWRNGRRYSRQVRVYY